MAGRRQESARRSARAGPHQDSSPWPHPSVTERYSDRMAKQRQMYFSSDFCLARIASTFHAERVDPVPNPVPFAQYWWRPDAIPWSGLETDFEEDLDMLPERYQNVII